MPRPLPRPSEPLGSAPGTPRVGGWQRLSTRLLLLTCVFVMVAEVLIFVPSIARFRLDFLRERLGDAHLAALAIEAARTRAGNGDTVGGQVFSRRLLDAAGLMALDVRHMDIAVRFGMDTPGTVPGLSPPIVDWVSLSDVSGVGAIWQLIRDAFDQLANGGGRVIQVQGPSPIDSNRLIQVDVLLEDSELTQAMRSFAQRILVLSLIISIITGSLIYLTLDRLLVMPLRRLTRSMMEFRDRPEADGVGIVPSRRRDELGLAERELAAMQASLRMALGQRARLAALGTAVVKINHDLRNILASVSLLSERLAQSQDPTVMRIAPRLVDAIDRAARLCEETLRYSRDGIIRIDRAPLPLITLLRDVEGDLRTQIDGGWINDLVVPEAVEVSIDRDQLRRCLLNLGRNALEAGATRLEWRAQLATGGPVTLQVRDNGPGLPPRALENLFQPFTGSARAGGTGLGLAIAQELIKAHGGEMWLVETGAGGTVFAMTLPLAGRSQPAPAPA